MILVNSVIQVTTPYDVMVAIETRALKATAQHTSQSLFTMIMTSNPVQIIAFILCISSSAYAQVFTPNTVNWGGRIAGIVLGKQIRLLST